MPSVSFDSVFTERADICRLSDKAFRIHISAILYADRYEMWVLPPEVTHFLRRRERGTKKHVAELVAGGLWLEVEGGHAIPQKHRPRQASRPYISRGLRLFVYDRDGWACVVCGRNDDLSLDHIRPFSDGGSDTPDNLRTLCRRCNTLRGAARLTDDEVRRGR